MVMLVFHAAAAVANATLGGWKEIGASDVPDQMLKDNEVGSQLGSDAQGRFGRGWGSGSDNGLAQSHFKTGTRHFCR